jgi:potassium-transporting ATPase KdpC subunit
MLQHLYVNLKLTLATLVLACVLYPLALYALGQSVFRGKAEGSLLDRNGKVVTDPAQAVGSKLIAQPFSKDEYFQPRPSAASYNAAASGASNWGASNVLLRDRVARTLGPIAKYKSGPKKGQPAGPDIEAWFGKQAPDYVLQWSKEHSGIAEQWVKDHPDSVALFLQKEVSAVKDAPGDTGKEFFAAFVKRHSGNWPGEEEAKAADGKAIKQIKPIREGSDIQSYLFDPWLAAHPDVELEKVPADMVMASASGLDPHITLQNAQYQLDRVAGAWAGKTKQAETDIRREIETILQQKAEAPLGGLVGVPLVNVLEVNLALASKYGPQSK